MTLRFDIFRLESSGAVRWIEAARNLEAAMTRIEKLAVARPGRYMVFNSASGTSIYLGGAEQNVASQNDLSMAPTRNAPDLREVLLQTVRLASTDLGTLQILHPATNSLKIVAQCGFSSKFVEYFNAVHSGEACCGAALKRMRSVVVDNVTTHPIFRNTEAGEVILEAGSRACKSIPLVTRTNKLVGMLSPHYPVANPLGIRHRSIPKQRITEIAELLDAQGSALSPCL